MRKSLDVERYKRLLLAKREEVLAAWRESKDLAASEPEGDFGDRANAEAGAKIQIRLRETEGHLLRAIDDALDRIRRGTFGLCTACGGLITKARLEAVPWTRLCRDCKEQEKGLTGGGQD